MQSPDPQLIGALIRNPFYSFIVGMKQIVTQSNSPRFSTCFLTADVSEGAQEGSEVHRKFTVESSSSNVHRKVITVKTVLLSLARKCLLQLSPKPHSCFYKVFNQKSAISVVGKLRPVLFFSAHTALNLGASSQDVNFFVLVLKMIKMLSFLCIYISFFRPRNKWMCP